MLSVVYNLSTLRQILSPTKFTVKSHVLSYKKRKEKTFKNPPGNVLSEFIILCWDASMAFLECMRSVSCRRDLPAYKSSSLRHS